LFFKREKKKKKKEKRKKNNKFYDTLFTPPILLKYGVSHFNMSSSTARLRLTNERRKWLSEHPPGFYAKPLKNPTDNSIDIMKWVCGIPGKKGVSFPE